MEGGASRMGRQQRHRTDGRTDGKGTRIVGPRAPRQTQTQTHTEEEKKRPSKVKGSRTLDFLAYLPEPKRSRQRVTLT